MLSVTTDKTKDYIITTARGPHKEVARWMVRNTNNGAEYVSAEYNRLEDGESLAIITNANEKLDEKES